MWNVLFSQVTPFEGNENFETRGRGKRGRWCKRAGSMGYIVDLKTLSGNTFVIPEQLYCTLCSIQIRNDSSQSLIELMPQLHARSQELPTIFRRIDQLEVLA